MESSKFPKVGVAVVIFNKEGKILVGKRISKSHGFNTWCVPGGKLEFKEDPERCAEREVMEEAGVKIKNLRFVAITNDIFEKENLHYITLWYSAELVDGEEAKVMEPDKFECWKWVKPEDVKNLKPLFLPFENFLKLSPQTLFHARKD